MRTLTKMMALLAVMLLAACGDDVEPVQMFYDSDGKVFLENGKMHECTTSFTEEELLKRLQSTAWVRDYAFFYDDKKCGGKDLSLFMELNFLCFESDGQGYMGTVGSKNRIPFTYSVNGRQVSYTINGTPLTMRVAAIDATMMVVDSKPQFNPADFDPATVRQRTVFKHYVPASL